MPANEGKLTFEEMLTLWREGAVGYVEFRNWLANYDISYDAVRDKEIDDDVVERAKERRAADALFSERLHSKTS
jgi:hypothetical protein